MEYKRLEIERIDFDDLPNWMEDTNELPPLPPEWQELQEEMKDFPGCPNGPGCVAGKMLDHK